MRHGNKVKKLGRTHAHRKATMAALSSALIQHKRITTTLPKAKALRSYVEPIIHRAKEDTTHNRREVFRHLQDKEAVKAVFGDIAGVIGDRPGGYTRIVKLGQRAGDAAEVAVIELVDFNDVKPAGAAGTKRRTRRSRRSGASADAPKAAAPKATAKAAAAKPAAAKADAADDLTKVWGVGPVFAAALNDAGITTFAQLAAADLDALRTAIAEGSNASDESANEETWAQQARLLANGDTDGHAAFVERLKAGETPEAPAAEATGVSANEGGPAPVDQAAEAAASDAQNPATTGNPQVPTSSDHPDHGDSEQGAAPGTGEPPPEAGLERQQGHRG